MLKSLLLEYVFKIKIFFRLTISFYLCLIQKLHQYTVLLLNIFYRNE